uniref:Uncharacterized protein n=1 Tax=Vombatus ursinus TaxID=29139 RepID=A0A4X2LLD6_VOMUR
NDRAIFFLSSPGPYPRDDCVLLEGNECHLVVVNSTSYNVNHTFKDPGRYCLSIRVQYGINHLHQYHLIKVWATGIHPALFVLPCVLLISGMLSFIMYVTYRNSTQQKDLVEPKSGHLCCMRLCCHCFLCPPSHHQKTIRESHGLLHPFYKPVKSYSV